MKNWKLPLATAALSTMLFGGAAFAATDNTVSNVPSVDNDGYKVLGSLRILESENNGDSFIAGDTFVITLPADVEFNVDSGDDLVASKMKLLNGEDSTGTVSAKLSNDKRTLTVTIGGTPKDAVGDEGREYITIGTVKDGKVVGIPVKLDGFDGGDIDLTIDGMGSGITSGEYTIGRAISGDADVTVLKAETVGQIGEAVGGTIRITENSANALGDSEAIKFTLPSDFEWAFYDDIDVAKGALEFLAGFDGKAEIKDVKFSANKREVTYYVEFTDVTKRGIIEFTPTFTVDSDADYGDVEVTVEGINATGYSKDVSKTDVVVAKYADWGVEIYADGDIEELLAGQIDEELTTLVIEENIDESLLPGRTIEIEFPDYVKIVDASVDGDKNKINSSPKYNSDYNKITYTVNKSWSGGDAEVEFDFDVSISIDAPAGDLVAKISGSAGAEGEVVLGKIVKPITATADTKDIILGEQAQLVGDITITESTHGAIMDDNGNLVIELPEGVKFANTPKVEVVEGNLDIDAEDVDVEDIDNKDDAALVIKIDGESTKASTIKISDIKVTVDRTVPFGAITAKIKGEALTENYAKDPVDKDGEFDDLTAAKVVIANLTTPAVANNATFWIGSTVYSQNGTMKTMDVAPYIKGDRTYVPVRFLAYALGVTEEDVKWDAATQTVTVTKGENEVQLVIGSKTILVNGQAQTMDVAPEITNDYTFLPARYVAEGLGAKVGWNPTTQAVVITQ